MKPAVDAMMARAFSGFDYAFTIQPRYFFCRGLEDGLSQYLVFQRDGAAGALYVDLAVTYDPCWKGVDPGPLGRWESLAQVKAGARRIEAMEHWYFYRSSASMLAQVLDQIAREINRHGLAYLEGAARGLQSDKLLQYGLEVVRRHGPLAPSAWQRLSQDMAAVTDLRTLRNPDFEKLRKQLLEFAEAYRLKQEHRQWINRIASDLLWSRIGSSRERSGRQRTSRCT